jgi:hypothetical protein
MPLVTRYLPSAGALAVYETANVLAPSDAPLTDPLNNLNVIKFHSGLRYPRFIPAKTVDRSYTLNPNPSGSLINTAVDLYAHGMADTPIVLAKYQSGSSSFVGANPSEMPPVDTPWTGSLPLINFGFGIAVWGSIESNATHVRLILEGFSLSQPGTFAQYTFNMRLYVLDTSVTVDQFDADGALPMLQITSSRVRVGRGKFDTNFAYLRQGSTTDPIVLVEGESMVIKGTPNANPLSDPNQDWGWRSSVNGKTRESAVGGTSTFTASFKSAGL